VNWRWLILDYVPPELALTHAQRREATRRMYTIRWRFPAFRWVLVLLTIIGVAIPGIGGRMLGEFLFRVGLPEFWAGALGVGPALLLHVGLMLLIFSLVYVRPMRRALREMGYDVCVRCGYWLRGLDNTVVQCPECGAAREGLPEGEPS
jgi:hypothetical protein